jgi:DNA-binding CsgD family transcriptional regulator
MTHLSHLSNREQEVTDLLMQGMSNKEIAADLSITVRTVEFHLQNIYAKCQVGSRVELVLHLGQGAARSESERLRESTVEIPGNRTENGETSNGQVDWILSMRETLSRIGKELRMKTLDTQNARETSAPMTFQDSIRTCLTNYATFEGRASRPEFWWFFLFINLVTAALVTVNEMLGTVFLIAMALPLLAVGARRLRDTGRSGWWQLFWLVPVGGIVVLAVVWSMPQSELTADGIEEPSI